MVHIHFVLPFVLFIHLDFNVECRTNRPNILIFLADDMGIGDVGCFGNNTLNTPNLDRICQKGMKLTHNLAAAPVCTPSRAAFLTSRYPIRSGTVPEKNAPPVYLYTSGSGGLPTNEATFASMLKTANYSNGYFGKWHQGVHCEHENDFCHFPLNHGFDYYYGMPLTNLEDCGNWFHFKTESRGNLMSFSTMIVSLLAFLLIFLIFQKQLGRWFVFPLFLGIIVWYFHDNIWFLINRKFNCIVMRNYKVVEQTVNLETFTTTLTNEIKDFITRNKDGSFLAVVAFQRVHTALTTASRFAGKSKHGKYGDSVEELDWSVGEIMKILEDLNLVNDTFVYFSSDHGPALHASFHEGEYHGGSKSNFRGGKSTNYEGGIRVPTMVQLPGVIQAGSVYDKPTSLMDVLPTIVFLANVPLNQKVIDGRNIMQILTGNKEREDRFLFHYCYSNIQAITYSSVASIEIWKIHYSIPIFIDGTELCRDDNVCFCIKDTKALKNPLIYELRSDPGEKFPLSNNDSLYKELLKMFSDASKEHTNNLIPVEKQLTNNKNSFSFKRALSLCCNFPLCYC